MPNSKKRKFPQPAESSRATIVSTRSHCAAPSARTYPRKGSYVPILSGAFPTQNPCVYIFLRMNRWILTGEPEVFPSFDDAAGAFEAYTGQPWAYIESLSEESGANPDEILGEPFAGSRILTVEIPRKGSVILAA